MKEVFLRLKKRDLIEPVPEKRGNLAAWRKINKATGGGGAAAGGPTGGLFD
jgi:hypothetical protein